MSGVLVHLPSEGRTETTPAPGPVSLRLGPGDVARFGRGSASVPVDLRLADPAVSRLAGEIRVTEDHWQLSNLSTSQTYLVENPEGAGEYFRVPPRRAGAPVPFEFARVVLPARGSAVTFQVFAPDHAYLGTNGTTVSAGTGTLAGFSLDETSTYFLVLLALCEPRLRDESPVAVATTPQIVERLRHSPGCERLTARAVSSHIDYLADEKLRITTPAAADATAAGAGRGVRRTGKREAVAALALRFGLVREEHLGLLPPRRAVLQRTGVTQG
ncbi:serine/threonine protein kinase [Streptomyces sp. MBT97]|uniref:FHA domain-containing protein n=1 Tax=Streptomyces sp. MBT97 TaxID=2800411 RepID=UPI00190BDA6A|nr:FHA domain-containing protein [Streptomyces sp. MBT97]MBK3637007.1 serine/threonine protein kinase [Streptomyces sp. MBT97]